MNKAEKVEQRGKGMNISLYLQHKDDHTFYWTAS